MLFYGFLITAIAILNGFLNRKIESLTRTAEFYMGAIVYNNKIIMRACAWFFLFIYFLTALTSRNSLTAERAEEQSCQFLKGNKDVPLQHAAWL